MELILYLKIISNFDCISRRVHKIAKNDYKLCYVLRCFIPTAFEVCLGFKTDSQNTASIGCSYSFVRVTTVSSSLDYIIYF